MKDIKEAYPVQLAEYAVSMKLAGEPAFAWWVPHTLKKRNKPKAKIKYRDAKRMLPSKDASGLNFKAIQILIRKTMALSSVRSRPESGAIKF